MRLIFIFLFLISFINTAQADIQTEVIEYKSGGTVLQGFLAYDDSLNEKRPGVLVVHEWWGHNKHARNRAIKLAEIGYTAFALDMYGKGKLADHPKKAGEFMTAAFEDWKGSQEKFNAAKQFLQKHNTVDPEHIGAIGFCFGGAVSLRMARGGADLDGVVAFHSALPLEPAIIKGGMTSSALIINGSDDSFLKSETVATFMKEVVEANADVTYSTLSGIQHSYTNPQADHFAKKFEIPNLRYDKEADERSWKQMSSFFERVFAK